jgi:hypothetical protein
LGARGIRSFLIGRHETRRGGSLWDTPTLLPQDLLHRALSRIMSLDWRCGTWLRRRCISRKQSCWSHHRWRRMWALLPQTTWKGFFYYVMILLFLLISNLITKCRHSYLDSNVRRDGRDLQKIKLIRKSRTTKPWHKGSSGS